MISSNTFLLIISQLIIFFYQIPIISKNTIKSLLNNNQNQGIIKNSFDRLNYGFEAIKPENQIVFLGSIIFSTLTASFLANIEYDKKIIPITQDEEIQYPDRKGKIIVHAKQKSLSEKIKKYILSQNNHNKITIKEGNNHITLKTKNIEKTYKELIKEIYDISYCLKKIEEDGKEKIVLSTFDDDDNLQKRNLLLYISGTYFKLERIENPYIIFNNTNNNEKKKGNLYIKKNSILFITKDGQEEYPIRIGLIIDKNEDENKKKLNSLQKDENEYPEIQINNYNFLEDHRKLIKNGWNKIKKNFNNSQTWKTIKRNKKKAFILGLGGVIATTLATSYLYGKDENFEEWKKKKNQKLIFEKIKKIKEEKNNKRKNLEDMNTLLKDPNFNNWYKKQSLTKEKENYLNKIINTFEEQNKNTNNSIDHELIKKIILYREFNNNNYFFNKTNKYDFYKNFLLNQKIDEELHYLNSKFGNIKPQNQKNEENYNLLISEIENINDQSIPYFDQKEKLKAKYTKEKEYSKNEYSDFFKTNFNKDIENEIEAEHLLIKIDKKIQEKINKTNKDKKEKEKNNQNLTY